MADKAEEQEDSEWAEAMRLVLSNGLDKHTKKLGELIELRFRSQGRRERERHQDVKGRLERVELMLTPLAHFHDTAARVGGWALKGLGIGGAVTGAALAIAKGMGWI